MQRMVTQMSPLSTDNAQKSTGKGSGPSQCSPQWRIVQSRSGFFVGTSATRQNPDHHLLHCGRRSFSLLLSTMAYWVVLRRMPDLQNGTTKKRESGSTHRDVASFLESIFCYFLSLFLSLFSKDCCCGC